MLGLRDGGRTPRGFLLVDDVYDVYEIAVT